MSYFIQGLLLRIRYTVVEQMRNFVEEEWGRMLRRLRFLRNYRLRHHWCTVEGSSKTDCQRDRTGVSASIPDREFTSCHNSRWLFPRRTTS